MEKMYVIIIVVISLLVIKKITIKRAIFLIGQKTALTN